MLGLSTTLKRQNAPALCALLATDTLFLFAWLNNFEVPSGVAVQTTALRTILSLAAPPIGLLLASAVPVGLKDFLVFWRFRHTLPGHRAFSVLGPADPRVDMERLRRNLSASFPSGPKEQNTFWYGLFKKVEMEPGVEQCNRAFMLLRDIAAVSFLAATALSGWWLAGRREMAAAGAVLFGAQYLLAASGAWDRGRRLVTTVLAAHAVKRRR
jgi:hypothetical protein